MAFLRRIMGTEPMRAEASKDGPPVTPKRDRDAALTRLNAQRVRLSRIDAGIDADRASQVKS